MRVFAGWPQDGRHHRYCSSCRAEATSYTEVLGQSFFQCQACGVLSPRVIDIDPAVRWWIDARGEYWHESAGVFIREPQGRFLFFRRTGFPFAFTVPSGHVNVGEEAASAASREVLEEIGIRTEGLVALGVHDLVGDSCWRGSDAHRWHAYLATAPRAASPAVLEEGECARWFTLGETAHLDLVYPARFIIQTCASALLSAS